MRSLGLIAAFAIWTAVVLPNPSYAQLFDGPEPEVATAREEWETEASAFESPAFESPEDSLTDDDHAPSDDVVIINTADLDLGDPNAEFRSYSSQPDMDSLDPEAEPLLEDYLPFEQPCGTCAGCRPCGGGCGDSGWVCLEDIINWHNVHAHLTKLFGPLGIMPAKHHLHKLKERTPMSGTSWLNRPLHADWFMGAFVGDKLTSQYNLDTAFVGGYRLGRDVSENWGYETRLMFAAPNVTGPGGLELPSTADVVIWDVSAVYYPWGDTTTRPYFTTGLGIAHFDYRDGQNAGQNANVLAIPIGGGVKWRYNNWTLVRVELLDNISFSGSGVSSMHNFTITGGIEIRFGGRPTGYWPWNPTSYIR